MTIESAMEASGVSYARRPGMKLCIFNDYLQGYVKILPGCVSEPANLSAEDLSATDWLPA